MSAIQLYQNGGGGFGGSGDSGPRPEPYRPSLAEKIACVQVDALPYVDSEFNDPAMQAHVRALVQAEMQSFTPPDYLAQLELKDHQREAGPASELLQAEMRRVERGEVLKPVLAAVEPPPKSLEHDLGAWQSSVRTAQAQLEHQRNRLLNLELLAKYGPSVWVDALRHTDAAGSRCARSHGEGEWCTQSCSRRALTPAAGGEARGRTLWRGRAVAVAGSSLRCTLPSQTPGHRLFASGPILSSPCCRQRATQHNASRNRDGCQTGRDTAFARCPLAGVGCCLGALLLSRIIGCGVQGSKRAGGDAEEGALAERQAQDRPDGGQARAGQAPVRILIGVDCMSALFVRAGTSAFACMRAHGMSCRPCS
jgi:hypothetical protein